jgi:hypothetical protein
MVLSPIGNHMEGCPPDFLLLPPASEGCMSPQSAVLRIQLLTPGGADAGPRLRGRALQAQAGSGVWTIVRCVTGSGFVESHNLNMLLTGVVPD